MPSKKKTPRRLPAKSLVNSSSGGDISVSGRTRPTRSAGGLPAGALRSAVQKQSSKKSPTKKGKSAAAPPSATKKRVRSASPADADGDDDEDEEDDEEEAEALPPSTPTPSPRKPRARLLEAHFLPCQRCLRQLATNPDLECPGPGPEPCPRCKGMKKSAAECCPVPAEQLDQAARTVELVATRAAGWEDAVKALDMAMRRRSEPRSAKPPSGMGSSAPAAAKQGDSSAVVTANPPPLTQQSPSGYPAPFGGPMLGVAAPYGPTMSPYMQRGLSAPGYREPFGGYGAAFDPELARLLAGVHESHRALHEAQRALDDYLRFRGFV
ncbi:hypothetical protein PISL3812_10028 [Talaromyces islandicus]|uniref:Uncharacterized protein n=1 Tax=Talaromyces islandicus TaxID=28573 RepID=A0A0U1MBM3_TALIS|nr:hypothetical protein PISL3812_10028 [Talaromyces islandicus]